MKCLISCSIKREHDSPGDFLYNDYIRYFADKGVDLVPVPNVYGDVEKYFDMIGAAGLVLSGGNDIGSEPARDEQEKRLLVAAIERKIPVFAICRGMQFVNFYFSGTMPLELASAFKDTVGHVAVDHTVRVLDKKLAERSGSGLWETNSFHRYGYRPEMISPELEVIAVSEKDDVVEAVRHKEYPIAGVQWHPERKSPHEGINDVLVGLLFTDASGKKRGAA